MSFTLFDKIKSGTGNPYADGEFIQFDNTNANGLLNATTNINDALKEIDNTGFGSSVVDITENFTASQSNATSWFNREIRTASSLSNGDYTLTLPSLADINSAKNSISSNVPVKIMAAHFGGTSSSLLENKLTVLPHSSGPAIFGRSTNIVLGYSDCVTVLFNSTENHWEIIQGPGSTSSSNSNSLNNIELQDETWDASTTGNLPTGVSKGYAYQVVNAPTDGTGRFNVSMENGDWVVWKADTFSSWSQTPVEWFVLPGHDVKRITVEQSKFLSQIQESTVNAKGVNYDTIYNVKFRLYTDETEYSVSNFDTTAQEGSYTDTDASYGAIIYISIETTQTQVNSDAENLNVYLTHQNGSVLLYNFNDRFTYVETNGAITYWKSNLHHNYEATDTLNLFLNYDVDSFTINNLNIAPNLTDNLIEETKLSQTVREKLNLNAGLTPKEQFILDQFTENSTSGTIDSTQSFQYRYGGGTLITRTFSQGIIPPSVESPVSIFVGKDFTITSLSIANLHPTIDVTEQEISLVNNTKQYDATIPAVDANVNDPLLNPVLINGTQNTVTSYTASEELKVGFDNFEGEVINRIDEIDSVLPDTIKALASSSDVVEDTNDNWLSEYPYIGVKNSFATLKNVPPPGSHPISADDFYNEITDSSVIANAPDGGLTSIFVSGSSGFDGVPRETNNQLTEPAIVDDRMAIQFLDQNNYRLILGMWLYNKYTYSDVAESLIQVRRSDNNEYETIVGIKGNKLSHIRADDNAVPTTTRTVQHQLSESNGEGLHQYPDSVEEASYIVNEAREYTILLRAEASGIALGPVSQTFNIPSLDENIHTQTIGFVFTDAGYSVTQNLEVSYNAKTVLYEGPGHRLRLESTGWADSGNVTLTGLSVQVVYNTTETIPGHSQTFSQVEIDEAALSPNRVHKCIFQFDVGSNNNIRLSYNIDGAKTFSPVTYNVTAFRYLWDMVKVGHVDMVYQNVQGAKYTVGTDSAQFFDSDRLRDLVRNQNSKTTDFVFGLITPPQHDIETLYFRQPVTFQSQILVSPGNRKYLLGIDDDGAIVTEEIT